MDPEQDEDCTIEYHIEKDQLLCGKYPLSDVCERKAGLQGSGKFTAVHNRSRNNHKALLPLPKGKPGGGIMNLYCRLAGVSDTIQISPLQLKDPN
jgi:hypothetical protein